MSFLQGKPYCLQDELPSPPRSVSASVIPERSQTDVEMKTATSSHSSAQTEEAPLPPATYELLERERNRIARELHDDMGQLLVCLKMGLQQLEQELDLKPSQRERLRDLAFNNDLAMQSARRLAHGLRSPLSEVSLDKAIAVLVEQFSGHSGLEFSLSISEAVVGLNETVATTIYRFLQEALTNVLRHAHASCVELVVVCHGDRVQVSVEDNGLGFDPELRDAVSSYGLRAMRERVEAQQGRFMCDSEAGRGTMVCISLPIQLNGES